MYKDGVLNITTHFGFIFVGERVTLGLLSFSLNGIIYKIKKDSTWF